MAIFLQKIVQIRALHPVGRSLQSVISIVASWQSSSIVMRLFGRSQNILNSRQNHDFSYCNVSSNEKCTKTAKRAICFKLYKFEKEFAVDALFMMRWFFQYLTILDIPYTTFLKYHVLIIALYKANLAVYL